LAFLGPFPIDFPDDLQIGPRLLIPNPLRLIDDLTHAFLVTPVPIFFRLVLVVVDALKITVICLDKTSKNILLQVFLVAFDGQGIVALFVNDLPGNLFLTTHRINRDERSLNIQ
jgi:hypothetical protein